MPTPRTGMELTVIYKEIYTIGGENNGTLIWANEKYTPSGYIQEFPSWMILSLVLTATTVTAIYEKRLTKTAQAY